MKGDGGARQRRCQMLVALLLIGPALLLEQLGQPGSGWEPARDPARTYAERAIRTQRFAEQQLGFLAGADRCGASAYLAFERLPASPLSDAWYNASQLMADAALIRLGQPARACVQEKLVAFLDLLARPGPVGGFYPRLLVDGRELNTRDTYADDNALIGLALLEARAVSSDPTWRASLLRRAASAATFLTDGGLWDETFGGGFWWNTNLGRMPEGKPLQTTALAAELFARLFEATAEQRYADWAQRSLAWLEARLFDPAAGLYRYTVRYWDMPGQGGEYVEPRFVGYDQGIMIEVHLLVERSIEPGGGHLERARALAEHLQATFWDPDRGTYRMDSTRSTVFSGYSAWLTQSLLALHAADPDPIWLARARANLDGLEAYLYDSDEGGYYHLHFACRRPDLPGCEHGARWSYDPTKLLFSQAWMQRGQALLAERLALAD